LLQIDPAKVQDSVAARRIALNCYRFVPVKVQQSVAARRIVTDWFRESGAICRSAPNCAELLQIDPAKVHQSIAARRIALNCYRLNP
jgi:hypothetical protein